MKKGFSTYIVNHSGCSTHGFTIMFQSGGTVKSSFVTKHGIAHTLIELNIFLHDVSKHSYTIVQHNECDFYLSSFVLLE